MGATGVGKREGTGRDDINLAEEFESVFIGMLKRNGISGVDRAAVNRPKAPFVVVFLPRKSATYAVSKGYCPFRLEFLSVFSGHRSQRSACRAKAQHMGGIVRGNSGVKISSHPCILTPILTS
jgi:hypothetical protein